MDRNRPDPRDPGRIRTASLVPRNAITPFRLSPSDLEGLDALRDRWQLPTRAAVVRRLIAEALATPDDAPLTPAQVRRILAALGGKAGQQGSG